MSRRVCEVATWISYCSAEAKIFGGETPGSINNVQGRGSKGDSSPGFSAVDYFYIRVYLPDAFLTL